MLKGICICSVILLMVFGLAVNPAIGFKVTVNTKEATATTKCDLGNSAQFSENTLGGSGGVYQKAEISGTGENSVEKTASGDGYVVMSSFGASGTVNSLMSTAASGNGAAINSQTGISGEAGYIASGSSTGANYMGVTGGFSGEGGYLSTDLISVASDGERAYTGGSASMLGVECLNGDSSQGLASGADVAMSVHGLYLKPDGDLADFGIWAVNEERPEGQSQQSPERSQIHPMRLCYLGIDGKEIPASPYT